MVSELTPVFVKYIPSWKKMTLGDLYISKEYNCAAHLCVCGCGNLIVTPITKDFWQLTEIEGKVSLNPSIGNWQIPCKTHYYITDNKINHV